MSMRLVLSLFGLIAIVLAVAWFGYGLPPKAVYYKTKNMLSSVTSTAGNEATNVSSASSRFSDVIKNNYNNQDMTEPSKF